MPQSPLHDRHLAAGARFTAFGDWKMPVQYESVLAEHRAVRSSTGVFDVSHLGRLRMRGDGATAVLRGLLCNDVSAVGPGRAQYTMALNDRGGVIDDIIVWRVDDDDYWVLPNGVNHDRIRDRIVAAFDGDVVDHHTDTVMLAVQGPGAPDLLERVLDDRPRRFRVEETGGPAGPVWAAGTGYTGESGCELVCPAGAGGDLWDAVVEAGAAPCGLGARDTLRLEMGYPLWGQDLDDATTPLEAGLGWVVDWEHDFVGKASLQAQRDGGIGRRLVAFATEGRSIPRTGYPLRGGGGTGVVTSGNFSPTLGHGIGMGYLSPPPNDGPLTVEVEIRGAWVPARRVDPPFLNQ